MRYISLFSGIEAASVAWEPLGWEPVAFSEIEPFCCDLLERRFPNVPNLGDISGVDWTTYEGMIDVVIGGSPCQAFSIAGQRKGLLDERGLLMLEYVRAIREVRPRWLVWENVPGVLSQDRGGAFGTLLGELAELGYSLSWRVLDAQFYGVAQRRRRVFLVGHPLPGCAAAVLFDPESLRWDPPTSREKREALAAATGRCIAQSGDALGLYMDATPKTSEDVSPTLRVGGEGGSNLAVAFAQNTRDEVRVQGDGTISGALSAQPDMKQTTYIAQPTAFKYSAGGAARTMPAYDDGSTPTLVTEKPPAVAVRTANTGANGSGVAEEVAHTLDTNEPEAVLARTQYGEELAGTLTARHDSSPCADRGQNVVLVQNSNGENMVGALCARDYKGVGSEYVGEGKVLAMASGQANAEVSEEVASTLSCLHEAPIVAGPAPVMLKMRHTGTPNAGGGEGAMWGEDVSYTLSTSQDQTMFQPDGDGWVVRRLMPVECERLQGFPDGWTDLGDTPDGPRYKALGNSMAVPVIRAIGEGIERVERVTA